MIFSLIGIDYKTVSLQEIELAHRLRREIVEFWQRVNPGKAVVLITCNRVEIYSIALNIDEVLTLEKSFRQIFGNCFRDAYVAYGYDRVFEHGLRLAIGLESQLRGELQIMQQLEKWLNCDNFPIILKNIWNQIIKTGKELRALSGLNQNTIDIAELIFDDLKRNIIFEENTEIVVIGVGKIAALIAEKRPKSARLFFVARKKLAKAKELAGLSGGEALLRDEMPSRLVTVDAVISATSSPHYALRACDFEAALEARRRPLYIYDVAIPRDVAPEIYAIPFVKIKGLEDLAAECYQNNTSLARRLELTEKLIEDKLFKYKEPSSGEEYTDRYATQPACA